MLMKVLAIIVLASLIKFDLLAQLSFNVPKDVNNKTLDFILDNMRIAGEGNLIDLTIAYATPDSSMYIVHNTSIFNIDTFYNLVGCRVYKRNIFAFYNYSYHSLNKAKSYNKLKKNIKWFHPNLNVEKFPSITENGYTVITFDHSPSFTLRTRYNKMLEFYEINPFKALEGN
jgi:hypothetical protein